MAPPITTTSSVPVDATGSSSETEITSSTPTVEASAPETEARPFVLAGSLGIGASLHGGRNGTLFAINPIGDMGDFVSIEGTASLLFNLLDGNFRLRVGPELRGGATIGDENTGGSSLYNISIGPRIEADWRRFYGNSVFAGPSRIAIDGTIGYGGGSTTAETFSLHDQSGFEASVGAALNLFNVDFGGAEVGLDIFARTSAIFGDSFNTPFITAGGYLTFRTSEDQPVTHVNECNEVSLDERIHEIAELNAELRTSYDEHRNLLASLSAQLDARGIDRAELIENLRDGYEIYLENRETEPVADAAERESLAMERYPDDFDPYSLPDVPQVEVPDPLPTECDDLSALLNDLEDERADLNRQNGLAEGTNLALLIRLGVPAAAEPHLARAITRLQEIHFITNRPFGAARHERGYQANADISTLDTATTAYLSAHPAGSDGLREASPMVDLENVFSGVFPRTRRATGEWFSPSLEAISSIAESLRSPDMANATFYIVGNTDSRGPDDHNQGLSERRARAIMDALIMFGVPPERLVAIGRGERAPIYYYDVRRGGEHALTTEEVRELAGDGITGSALSDEIFGRQTTNRRVEMFVCLPAAEGADADPVCVTLSTEPTAADGRSTTRTEASSVADPVTVVSSTTEVPAEPSTSTETAPRTGRRTRGGGGHSESTGGDAPTGTPETRFHTPPPEDAEASE